MWETILDLINAVLRHGFSLTTAGAVLVLLLKNRKLKNYINRHLPQRFQDHEQEKLDYIIYLLEGGEPLSVNSKVFKSSAKNVKTLSTSRWPGKSVAPIVAKCMTYPIMKIWRLKRMKFLNKISSRKFWALAASLVTANMILFGYSEDVIVKVVAVITQFGSVVAYLLVEGAIDKESQRQQVYIMPGSTTNKEGDEVDARSEIADQPRV